MGWLPIQLPWLVILLPWLAALWILLWDVSGAKWSWSQSEKLSFASLAVNTATVVIISVFAYHEAKRQSDLTDHRSRVEHRGQLVDKDWTFPRLESGEMPAANLELFNNGRTAAYVLAGTYEAVVSVDLPSVFADNPRPLPGLPGIIRKDQARPIAVSEHLPSIDVAALREGKQFFYLRIIVWWKDIFGDLYEMRATAKYGRMSGATGFGVEFPEVSLCKEGEAFPCQSWKLVPKEFVRLRQFNSHKLFEE